MRGEGKARIIAAAHEALLQHGRGGIRIDDVAQAANINKRMIYHYFGDREGLIAGVLAKSLALVGQDKDTGEETKLFLADLYRDLEGDEDASPLTDVSSAQRILLTDALYHGSRKESKYSLTHHEQRQLALVIAGCLYPQYVTLTTASKPVYRLQSDSKRAGSNES